MKNLIISAIVSFLLFGLILSQDQSKTNILALKSGISGQTIQFDILRSTLADEKKTVGAEVMESLILNGTAMSYSFFLLKCSEMTPELESSRGKLIVSNVTFQMGFEKILIFPIIIFFLLFSTKKFYNQYSTSCNATSCAGQAINQQYSTLLETKSILGFQISFNSQKRVRGLDGALYQIAAFVNVLCPTKQAAPETSTMALVEQTMNGTDYRIVFNHFSIAGCPVGTGPKDEPTGNPLMTLLFVFGELLIGCWFGHLFFTFHYFRHFFPHISLIYILHTFKKFLFMRLLCRYNSSDSYFGWCLCSNDKDGKIEKKTTRTLQFKG